MKKRSALAAGALALTFILSGCQSAQPAQDTPSPTPQAVVATQTPVSGSALSLAVQALLSPYDAALNQVSIQSPANMDYTIPGDLLRQMVLDAEAAGAAAADGRYQFFWRQSGNYAYESTAEEPSATADPADEAPMDSQLMGDYAVSGGGLFERVRAYDVLETLQSGRIEIVDTLNGAQTGHEAFSFAVRGDRLYFADAVLDMAAGVDSVAIQKGYLAAVGYLAPDGVDIIEYHIDDLQQLPDPAALDMAQLSASVEVLTRLNNVSE